MESLQGMHMLGVHGSWREIFIPARNRPQALMVGQKGHESADLDQSRIDFVLFLTTHPS